MGFKAIGLAGVVAVVGCGDNIAGQRAVESSPVVAVDTVAPESVEAGDRIDVDCRFFDETGATIDPIPAPTTRVRVAPEDAVMIDDAGDIMAIRAGAVEVSCLIPELVVFDDTPSLVAIEPGEVALLGIELDRDRISAGESVEASCSAFDAFGNRVDDAEPTLIANPALPGNSIADLTATFTGSGGYQLACDLANAAAESAPLEVLPGLPAAIVVSPVPARPVYARGEVIGLGHQVVDRFDNPVPEAVVSIASAPSADVSDGVRFRYFSDGFYQLTATVTSPTDGGVLLSDNATVLINGGGPAITCDSDGEMFVHTPGTPLTFSGSVGGLSGVDELLVNGAPVALTNGSFSTSINPQFGANFVDLAATDEFGTESTRVCSFIVSDRYTAEGGTQSGAVSLNLRQAAIDDANRSGALGSLGDLLHTAINSTGLKNQIHALLLGSNPLKDSCDIGGPFGICLFRSRIDYLSSNFAGVNTVSLDLVSGGIEARLTINDARLRMRIRASLGIDTTGFITASTATVRVIFDASLSGGRPRLTVRSGSVQTTVGSIDTDFSGLSGTIIDVIAGFAEGTIRNLIEDEISDLVRTSLGAAIDDLVANLDIGALAAVFDVPRLDGGSDIRVFFAPSFTDVNANNTRLQFGLGTRFATTARHARPSLGAPAAEPPGPTNPSGAGGAAVAIHTGVLNQVLHALWRAGMFDATLDASGATASLTTGLPPVVTASGGRVEIALADVAVSLSEPTLFPDPIPMILGVRGSMRFQLSGDDISFDDFRIEELLFSSLTVAIDANSRDLIEGFLAEVLENVLATALNDALPALPIPSFDLPASLTQYGLPAGATLAVAASSLSAAPPQLVLLGQMVIQ